MATTRVTCNHEVYTAVAKELGLTFEQVKQIVNAQSLFLKQTMESNTFDGVRWPYLGVFRSKPFEIQIINHLQGLKPEQKHDFIKKLKQEYRARKLAELSPQE